MTPSSFLPFSLSLHAKNRCLSSGELLAEQEEVDHKLSSSPIDEEANMKAVLLNSYGTEDQFKLVEVPDPVPGAGEVSLRIAAVGLNPVDLYVRQGYMAQFFKLELPAIIGVDAAGTVQAVGPGVQGFAPGDRVIAHLPINGKGAYAERAVVPVSGLAKLPAHLSFEAGASLPLPGLTGRQAVDALGVSAGERVLVSGALGAVGRAAVQYLKELGARPVAGVRSTRLSEALALAGDAIDVGQKPASPSFDRAICLAAPVAAQTLAHVRDGGLVATAVPLPEGTHANHRVRVQMIMAHDDPSLLQRVVAAAARGELVIPVMKRFKLAEVAAAHRALAAGAGGKIVLLT